MGLLEYEAMDLRTYRAWSLQEALQLVREDLGPEAAVLYTRKAAYGIWGWFGLRQVEVVAAVDADVPSRFPPQATGCDTACDGRPAIQPAELEDYRTRLRQRLKELASHGPKASEFLAPGPSTRVC
jgi:flagellar biosynthesis protein FlhF